MIEQASPVSIGILLYPGAQLSVIYGLTDLFSIALQSADEMDTRPAGRIAVSHWKVRGSGLPSVICVHGDETDGVGAPGILIIPPTMVDLPSAEVRARLVDWLLERHGRGAQLISICSGIKLLAQTGLIGARTVSTHRNCAAYLMDNHPEVIVDLDQRIIEYPDIITAGGFMSWIEVGLLLVDRIFGAGVSDDTARFILPETGTGQGAAGRFVPPIGHGDAAVRRAQQHVHLNDGQGISISSMAKVARLERRTFIRRFTAATSTSPAAYCREVRIARARELLESGVLPQKEIASRLGYTDVSTFARAFRRMQGIAPGSYRKQFGRSYVSGNP